MKEFQELIEQTDWELLRVQKAFCLGALEEEDIHETERKMFQGLVHLLDHLQDAAAVWLGEEKVFGEPEGPKSFIISIDDFDYIGAIDSFRFKHNLFGMFPHLFNEATTTNDHNNLLIHLRRAGVIVIPNIVEDEGRTLTFGSKAETNAFIGRFNQYIAKKEEMLMEAERQKKES